MGEKKVTIMVWNVDLQCSKCYKKVKKVLCKLPQIQDQAYDEKNNKVSIKVVCCNPEKIRDKLCGIGDGAIKSIKILEPEKPKPPKKPKELEKQKPPEKPKEPEKPKPPEKPKEPEKLKEPEKPKPPEKTKEPEKPEEPEKPKEPDKLKEDPPKSSPTHPATAPAPAPVPCYPPIPVRDCCWDCYVGRGRGPCGGLVCNSWGGEQMRYYDGYCGRPVCDGWGGSGGYGVYRSRCTDYFCEENPNAACTIM